MDQLEQKTYVPQHNTYHPWLYAFTHENRCVTCDEILTYCKTQYEQIMSSDEADQTKIQKIERLMRENLPCCRFKLIAYYGYPNLPKRGG
jgi:hypothetical protein